MLLVIIGSKFFEVETLDKYILCELNTNRITHAKVIKFISIGNKKEYDLYNENAIQLLDIVGDINIYSHMSTTKSNRTYFPQNGFTFTVYLYNNDEIMKIIDINDKYTVSIGKKTYYIAKEELLIINSYLMEFD